MKPALAVILVRPSEEGNVGAVARAMANFGLTRLVLVEPATAIGERGRSRAVGAVDILDRIERHSSLTEAIASFQRVIGTSSHRQRLAKTQVVDSRDLAEALRGQEILDTALVFGPERSGLTVEELARCGIVARIATSKTQPTLNLAQAVLLISYELFGDRSSERQDTSPEASAGELAELMDHADRVLHQAGFARDSTYPGVVRDLRRLAARSRLTAREVQIFRGLCRRLGHALDTAGGPEG